MFVMILHACNGADIDKIANFTRIVTLFIIVLIIMMLFNVNPYAAGG